MANLTLTSILVDGISLTTVLGDVVVDHGDHVGSDLGLVDGGQSHSDLGGLILLGVDRDDGAGGGQRLKDGLI